MIIIETKVFTRQITKLLPDGEYRELQQELVLNPAAGDIIKHSGVAEIALALSNQG